MTDQSAVIPPCIQGTTAYSISSPDNFLMFDENDYDPLLDTFANDLWQEPAGGFSGSDISGIHLHLDENMIRNSDDFHQNPAAEEFHVNPVQISIWPLPPSPFNCTCCQTLREFFHINDNQTLKLEIHGRLGMISHAIQEKSGIGLNSNQNHEYFMFDFCEQSIRSVKNFLVQYCNDRKSEGYVMLQDPLYNFYDAMCIGPDGNCCESGDGFIQENILMNQNDQSNQAEAEGSPASFSKSYIALQREKTGKMKLRDLASYFHLPINAAAKEMNICASAIKNICRKEGLRRWPHRKIKSIKRQILNKKKCLNSNDAEERARVLSEIHELEQRLAMISGENIG